MKGIASIWFVFLLVVSLAFSVGSAGAITIDYVAVDLADTTIGEDLWEYSYTVSDYTFAADTGFTIYFDLGLYDLLDPFPTILNADWDVLTLNPDPSIPDDGTYDAYAWTDNASLSDPFTVSFIWLGSGTPGTQFFEVYDGNTWDVLESGVTTTAPVPEPATLLMMSVGLAGFGIRKKIIGLFI